MAQDSHKLTGSLMSTHDARALDYVILTRLCNNAIGCYAFGQRVCINYAACEVTAGKRACLYLWKRDSKRHRYSQQWVKVNGPRHRVFFVSN